MTTPGEGGRLQAKHRGLGYILSLWLSEGPSLAHTLTSVFPAFGTVREYIHLLQNPPPRPRPWSFVTAALANSYAWKEVALRREKSRLSKGPSR